MNDDRNRKEKQHKGLVGGALLGLWIFGIIFSAAFGIHTLSQGDVTRGTIYLMGCFISAGALLGVWISS